MFKQIKVIIAGVMVIASLGLVGCQSTLDIEEPSSTEDVENSTENKEYEPSVNDEADVNDEDNSDATEEQIPVEEAEKTVAEMFTSYSKKDMITTSLNDGNTPEGSDGYYYIAVSNSLENIRNGFIVKFNVFTGEAWLEIKDAETPSKKEYYPLEDALIDAYGIKDAENKTDVDGDERCDYCHSFDHLVEDCDVKPAE